MASADGDGIGEKKSGLQLSGLFDQTLWCLPFKTLSDLSSGGLALAPISFCIFINVFVSPSLPFLLLSLPLIQIFKGFAANKPCAYVRVNCEHYALLWDDRVEL